MHGAAVGVEGVGDAVGEAVHGERGGAAPGRADGGRTAGRGGLAGHGPGERRPGVRLGGDGTGDGCDREARVGQAEAQRVDVADETGVDEGHAPAGRHGREQGLRLGGVGGHAHVEAEGPQIVLQ
ncbi:hypothetical protein SCANM63S_08508 [Streptomyces canarius]